MMVIRYGCAFSFIGAVPMYFSIFESNYKILMWALPIYGAGVGLVTSPSWALFTESIPRGQISKYFTKRMMVVKFSSSIGPLITIFLFLYIGDSWTVEACAIIMLIGVSVNLIGMFILCTLSDDHAVVIKEESETVREEDSTQQLESESFADESAYQDEQSTTHYVQLDQVDKDHVVKDVNPYAELPGYGAPSLLFFPGHRVIPSFVLLHDIVVGIGFGISLRFFSNLLHALFRSFTNLGASCLYDSRFWNGDRSQDYPLCC